MAAKPGVLVRVAAARAVHDVVHAGRSVDDALARHAVDKSEDLSLQRMLVYGTLRRIFELQSTLRHYLDRSLKRRDRPVESLLLVGLFQLLHTRIPAHAAVAATVDAVAGLGFPKLKGLANAILRRAQREPYTPDSDEARWNHPTWMLERLRDDWPDDWQRIVEANNDRSPMWLRVNRRKTSVDDYLARLDGAGIPASRHPALPDGLKLDDPVPVERLPGFADGEVSVQDGGAQIAAAWIAEASGTRLLDACAAPGGKSAHWLELRGADVALTCVELDEDRAARIEETLGRLGLRATVLTRDASKPETWWDGTPFDAILLDAPCSASGVIRRHPDIKLLRRASDLSALSALQERLLSELWALLKPGGRLLYVTCSVFAQENENVVGDWLSNRPDARENDVLQNNNIRDLMRRKACGYQLLPGTAGMDGFYFACLEKAT